MTLDEICRGTTCDKSTDYHGYSTIYENHFEPRRYEIGSVLEIGVQFYNSIRAWLQYFPNARVYGVDVWECPTDKPVERFKFYLGDQGDRAFWKQFKESTPKLDIVIDDGCHKAEEMHTSFDELWPHMNPGSCYCFEDTHSLWTPEFMSPCLSGEQWIGILFRNLNWNSKAYHGHPNPQPYTLTELESTLESIHMTKGLVILKKK